MKTEQIKNATKSASAPENTDFGTWCLDMTHDRLYWSDEIYRLFGVSKGSLLPYYGTLYNIIHPDDRAAWTANWDLFIKGAIRLSIEHRILLPTGEIRHVHQSGERIIGLNNQLIWINGTVRDITRS